MTEYMPMPNMKATRLLVHTARRRIMCMSISGSLARSSTTTHSPARTTAAPMSPSTFGEPQPHDGASLTPRRRATSQADSSTAASQLIRPGVRTGDSGTKIQAHSVAMAAMTIGIQNSQW